MSQVEKSGVKNGETGLLLERVVPDRQLLMVNSELCRMLGYTDGELLSKSIEELIHPDDRARGILTLEQTPSGEWNSYEAEKRYLHKNGSPVWVTVCSVAMKDGSGSAVYRLAIIYDATERKRTEEHFRLMAEAAPYGMVMTNQNGTIVLMNSQIERLFGYRREELVGQPVEILVPEPSRGSHEEFRKQFSAHPQTTSMAARHYLQGRRKDGTEFPVEIGLNPITTEEGVLVLSSIVDVTERKRAEEALRISEAKFSKAFDASPAIMCINSLQALRYLEVNKAFEERTGYKREEVIGRTAAEIGIWLHTEELERATEKLTREQSLHKFEGQFRTRAGDLRTGLLSAEIVDFAGEPCVLTVAEDVTERSRSDRALRESEERFRRVANTAPVMIWMTGPDKRCTFLNQTWLDFTGRSVETELGGDWAEGIHPEDSQKSLDAYTRAFDRLQPFRIEYRLRRYDGEYRWVLDVGVPRFNADASLAGYIGSAVDVTDRKNAEEALATVSGRLMEAHEEERRRIARELHDDISQRLALLAIELQALEDIPPESRVEWRDRTRELLRRTEEIASDVQDLSHQLHSSKLEILGIVAAAKGFCRELSVQKGVKIDFTHNRVPSALPRDISLCLFRVLQEALHNAVKHSGARHFHVVLQEASGELHLTVSDPGVGFDLQEAMNSRGLGLVSMRERVNLVKGTITILSEPQGGTEVKVQIPVGASSRTIQMSASA